MLIHKVRKVIGALDDNGIGRGQDRLESIIELIYAKTNVANKVFLDVGCGEGILSFPPAYAGAQKVISLEPELDGSSQGFNERFAAVAAQLRLKNVDLKRITLQDYDYSDGPFDCVVMYNTINHLNESACENLDSSLDAKNDYQVIFQKLYENLSPGGLVVIADCSRRNFFGDLGLKNPLARTIEWEKHQSPTLWIEEMEKVGFKRGEIRWNPIHSLGLLRRCFANSFGAYLTNSHFIFTVSK